jgi:hypothetical protein
VADPGGQKRAQKKNKVKKFHGAGSFSCSLEVLHQDLGINSYNCSFFLQKNINFFNYKISQFLVIKSLDQDPIETIADSQHWKYHYDFFRSCHSSLLLEPDAEPLVPDECGSGACKYLIILIVQDQLVRVRRAWVGGEAAAKNCSPSAPAPRLHQQRPGGTLPFCPRLRIRIRITVKSWIWTAH